MYLEIVYYTEIANSFPRIQTVSHVIEKFHYINNLNYSLKEFPERNKLYKPPATV